MPKKRVLFIGERIPGTILTYAGVTSPKEVTPYGKVRLLWRCRCGTVFKALKGMILRQDGKGTKCCGRKCQCWDHGRVASKSKFPAPTPAEAWQHWVSVIDDLVAAAKAPPPPRKGHRKKGQYTPTPSAKAATRRAGKGYCFSVRGKWRAMMQIDGKCHNLGEWDTEEEAAAVRREAVAHYEEERLAGVVHPTLPAYLVRTRRTFDVGYKVPGTKWTYRGCTGGLDAHGHRLHLWDCECGTLGYECTMSRVVNGNPRSCGCVRAEAGAARWERYGEGIAGQTFGRGTVVRRTERRTRSGQALYEVKCGCEAQTIYYAVAGRLDKSCGCLRREKLAERNRNNRRK